MTSPGASPAWRDHVTIPDLLNLAGIKSANRMVMKAVAAKAWICYHSDDGQDGSGNHIGSILFEDKKTATVKKNRSARSGHITIPLRGGDTFIPHAANVWNRSGTLRSVPTKAAAKKAASDLATHSPL
jgi:hypothetical protein